MQPICIRWPQKPCYLCDKFLDLLHKTEMGAILAFLPKFGCHGNSLGFHEISDRIFEFADPINLTIRAKKSSISCAELKSVQFWLIFAQIWLP